MNIEKFVYFKEKSYGYESFPRVNFCRTEKCKILYHFFELVFEIYIGQQEKNISSVARINSAHCFYAQILIALMISSLL